LLACEHCLCFCSQEYLSERIPYLFCSCLCLRIGSNRLSPGVINHSYAGKLVVGVAYSADANNDGNCRYVESDKQAIIDLFEPVTAVPFEFEDNLLRGRWWKNTWNLPFNGISVAMGGITTDRIVDDPSLRKLAYKVMDETIATANADLANHGFPEEDYLPEEVAEQMMIFTDSMGAYKPSTMLDLHARKPMEVKYLFRTALDRATNLGVPVPHMETLVCQIEAFQRYHNLY
jgi:2-dehydropantoate 2-reductase